MTAALSLYRLLEQAEREGLTVPHGTATIRADGRLAAVIARDTGLYGPVLWLCLDGRPVREARAIVEWAQRDPDPREQIKALTNWARRRNKNIPDEVVRAAVAHSRGARRQGRANGWSDEDEAARERIIGGMGAA